MDVESTVKVSTRCARCKRTACVTIHDSLDEEDARDRATDVLKLKGNWGTLRFDAVDVPGVWGVICSDCAYSFDSWLRFTVEPLADDPEEQHEADR